MITEIIKEYNIILASKSPRRQELLGNLDIDFVVADIIDVDEKYSNELIKEEIPVFLSQLKSKAYLGKLKENDILITADTIVWASSKAFNKPKNRTEAIEMIKQLSDNSHKVYTGVTLTSLNKAISFYSETEVFFKKLSIKEINYYIDKYKPYDKAGAYGIQEWIGYVGITEIRGSYFNVMGLPVQQLNNELFKFIGNFSCRNF